MAEVKAKSTALATPYTPWAPEDAERSAAYVASTKVSKYDKLREGDEGNLRRFLPPVYEARLPYIFVHEHQYELEGRKIQHVCPAMMYDMFRKSGAKVASARPKCSSCRKAAELEASGRKADSERAWKIKSALNVYWQTIDVRDPDIGVRIFGTKPRKGAGGLYEPLMELVNDSGVDFTHPITGRNLLIKRKGQNKDTTYKLVTARFDTVSPPSPLADIGDGVFTLEEWLEQAIDLSTLAKIPTSQEIDALLDGEDEDAPPPPQRHNKPPRGERAQDLIESDDEDEKETEKDPAEDD